MVRKPKPRRCHSFKKGDEVLARTRTGKLHNLIITHMDKTGVELSRNKHSRPLWALTHGALCKAMDRV